MRFPLRVLFLLWPLAEVIVLILLGKQLGGWRVFALIVASMIIGLIALRVAGRSAVAQLRQMQVDPNTIIVDEHGNRLDPAPGRQTRHRGLLAVGGVLLLVPGMISSALGLLLLLPPVRAVVSRGATNWAMTKLQGSLGPVIHLDGGSPLSNESPPTTTGRTTNVEVVSIRPLNPEDSTPAQPGAGQKAVGPAHDDGTDRTEDR